MDERPPSEGQINSLGVLNSLDMTKNAAHESAEVYRDWQRWSQIAARRRGGADGHGIIVVVVTFPDAEGQADFLEVVDAVDALRLALGGGERRQEHGRENGDDGDDDEQLDERERRFLFENFFIG